MKSIYNKKLSNNKSINIPSVALNMEYLSENDKNDFKFGFEENVDVYSISFVNSASDVQEVRDFFKGLGDEHPFIISKIESARGVENIMSTRYGITIEGKKKDIWNYMSRIEDIDSAVLITSVSLSKAEEQDDDKKATPATPAGQTPQQNNSTSSDQPENWDDDTVLEASIVIQLYSVYQMDKPDTSQDSSAE